MPTCCAFNCNYKHVNNKTSGKTVHTFPFSRPLVLKKWIINVRRKNWIPKKWSVLCSDHFEEECFDRSLSRVRLKPNALPTLFDFPPHLKKKFSERNGPSQCFLEIESDFVESIHTSNFEPQQQAIKDHGQNESLQQLNRKLENDTPNFEPQQQTSEDHPYNESHQKLKHQLEKEMMQNSVYREQLKVKQQCIRSLVKKVHSMDDLVDHLGQKPKRHTKIDTKSNDTPNFESQQEDHSYNESPQKLKSKIEKEIEQSVFYRKKLKVKQQRIRRLSQKVHYMDKLVDHLRPETETHTKIDTKLNVLRLTQALGLAQWEGNKRVNAM